ncbi:SMI1/KNR4 family protein [Amycolatopsis sp. FU40]|uniref:SMI1/KNR4 family protein n=1 Tax=Amycolatopsis sp. FU40 TaxID=2914159 RepID=UPI001F39A23A|nr:SMI1/KNR4 family protein [Amycolatopsis sp. FU40]UKD53505.1 SMI1/KNR4 family protein [Amycolatopsis sp. FU40]
MPDYKRIFRGADPVPQLIDWAKVESDLGISLPPDYREFAENYPAVNIDDFLNIMHPCSSRPALNLIEQSPIIREMWSALWVRAEGDFPYPIFPADGGLFPWAYNDENGFYFWKTGGAPSTWTVVVVEALQWWEHPGGFGEFIAGLTAGEIASPVIESEISGPDYEVRLFD